MTPLKYLQGYPASLQEQVRQMIAGERLGDYLAQRYGCLLYTSDAADE